MQDAYRSIIVPIWLPHCNRRLSASILAVNTADITHLAGLEMDNLTHSVENPWSEIGRRRLMQQREREKDGVLTARPSLEIDDNDEKYR